MVKSVIQVEAPRTRVFSILTDYPRYQEWVAGCTSSTVVNKTDTTTEADVVISGMKRMTLGLRFEAFPEQTINFRPILAGELYGQLREIEVFNQVCIDPEVSTLVWPTGADFDPAMLHDWPAHQRAFEELARSWEPELRTNS